MKKESLIKKLKNRYDRLREQRQAREEAERPLKDRMDLIFSAPLRVNTDFWCNKCKRDCSGSGYRRVCTVRETAPTAWFVAYCPKGHQMIRRITDKTTDPYYEQSIMIQRQRFELADAILTPDDPRFKVLYPKQYKELMGKNKNDRKTTKN